MKKRDFCACIRILKEKRLEQSGMTSITVQNQSHSIIDNGVAASTWTHSSTVATMPSLCCSPTFRSCHHLGYRVCRPFVITVTSPRPRRCDCERTSRHGFQSCCYQRDSNPTRRPLYQQLNLVKKAKTALVSHQHQRDTAYEPHGIGARHVPDTVQGSQGDSVRTRIYYGLYGTSQLKLFQTFTMFSVLARNKFWYNESGMMTDPRHF